MRTHNLYLSTQVTSPANNLIVPVNKSNLGNVTWQVNFRELFGNDYGKYKRTVVRAQVLSETWAATNLDVTNRSGYLAVNLPSSSNSTTTLGTNLMLLYPSFSVTLDNPLAYYNVSSLADVNGVDIVRPMENQFINVMFVHNDAMTLMTTVPEYQLLLQFELSDEDDK